MNWNNSDNIGFICKHHSHCFMAIDPESFDEPVKDYDFSSLRPSSLIDQMALQVDLLLRNWHMLEIFLWT